jgi:hypothetical protein
MRKMFFALLLISSVSQAQYRLRYDKLFVEAGIGLAVPLSNISQIIYTLIILIHFPSCSNAVVTGDIKVTTTVSIGIKVTKSYS